MMFGGMCGGWKAKKTYEKYRKELEESPRTRRRLLQANIGIDESDAESVDDFVMPSSVTTEILLDFVPVSDIEGRELAVKRGDVVRVLYRTGEWLYVARKLGAEGYIPAGYCRAYASPTLVEQYDEERKCEREREIAQKQQQHVEATNGAKAGLKTKKFEKGDHVEAVYHFRAAERDDLSIARGDRLVVLAERDYNWLWVRNDAGDEGCVPATYVSICAAAAAPPPPPPRIRIDRSRAENDDVRSVPSGVKAKLQTIDPARRQFPHKQLPPPSQQQQQQHHHQRSHSSDDARIRAKSPSPQPNDRQGTQTRRFPPKLQPSNLTPISESGSREAGGRRRAAAAPTTHLGPENGYLNRSQSFTAVPAASYRTSSTRRQLENRLLESNLRPSDFSFDNISHFLSVADGSRRAYAPAGTLSAKLCERDQRGGSVTTSNNGSPTHSTISADSSQSAGGASTASISRRRHYDQMQIEARLRLSHSRLGIHSSQASIPIVSTTPPSHKRLLLQRHPAESDNAWSYSTP